jgi:hypothetical protein
MGSLAAWTLVYITSPRDETSLVLSSLSHAIYLVPLDSNSDKLVVLTFDQSD